MPSENCPVEGYQNVKIRYPDEWLMIHMDLFWEGYIQAPDNAAPATKEIFGTIALCEEIDGLDVSNIGQLPLSARLFFKWLVETVYYDSYLAAVEPPKN